ncbi:MAG: efflux RND transporter periplasmic adaptor subunit [Beijerinckiaceae bacterium]|nr:efflux RND transporter periplasmic adaptor subunit [Beijerinckiaceae bacterium]
MDEDRSEAPAQKVEAEQRPHGEAPQTQVPFSEREVPPPPRKRVFLIVLLVVGGALGYGAFEHFLTDQRATETQAEATDFVPEVTTITAKAEDGPIKLTLPGQTEPFNQSTIYPRATGYIAERRVDIGSHVKKGDLLIRISAPDLDQQLAQAKGQLAQSVAAQAQAQATLDQAKANLALAQVTSQRYQKLTTQGYETVQNNDNQKTAVQTGSANVEAGEAGIKVADANTKAAQATVDRLQALVAFERVEAPYDGVITTRGVEVGDLVNADSKTGTPLFTIAYDKTLRVTVHVPQANAFSIKDGLYATAYLPQKPEQTFSGHIARSSVALLNSARTLDTEVDVDNPDGALRPGAFVNVSFEVPRLHPNVVLPAEALVFNKTGMQVAVVQDGEVHMQTINIYRDFGKTVELRDGLSGGEQVVNNPPVDIADHMKVKVKPKPPEEQAKK